MMQAKDVKHGMTVTAAGSPDVWEILDRHPKANQWWIHRRDAAGAWKTGIAHQTDLTPVGAGSRQETLLITTEG